MGALIGIGTLIDKNIFEGGRLFGRGAYWKEGAKSNHYGNFKQKMLLLFNTMCVFFSGILAT